MISPEDYQTIADCFDDAYESMESAIDELTEMRATLNEMVASSESRRAQLLQAINQCGTSLMQQQVAKNELLSAVSSLQQHVTKNVGSVNSFLSDNAILVGASFASLSATAGYTIDNTNIA
jgi:hypothetical protein